MDVDGIVIGILGDVGVRVVRQIDGRLDPDRMNERWQAAIAISIREHPGTAYIDWRPYTFSELWNAPTSGSVRPAVDFGQRVARYIAALSTGEVVEPVDRLLAVDPAQRASAKNVGTTLNQQGVAAAVWAGTTPLARVLKWPWRGLDLSSRKIQGLVDISGLSRDARLDLGRSREIWQPTIHEHPGRALGDWRPHSLSKLGNTSTFDIVVPTFKFAGIVALNARVPSIGEVVEPVDRPLAADPALRFSARGDATNQALRVVAASAEPLARMRGAGAAFLQLRVVADRLNDLAIEDPGLASQIGDVTAAFKDTGLIRIDHPVNVRRFPVGISGVQTISNVDVAHQVFSPPDLHFDGGSPTQTTPGSRTDTYLNVGFDEAGRRGVSRGHRPFASGEEVDVWVAIGPRASDAVPGTEVEPIDPASLESGAELEVVLFPDAKLDFVPEGTLGSFRVVDEGDFPVHSRSDGIEILAGTQPVYRLYARMTLPNRQGTWRLRVGLFLRGVLLQVQQVTVPVGTGITATAWTTYALVRNLRQTEEFSSLRTPTLTIYANAGDETHDFAFYLPNGNRQAISKVVHLDTNRVVTMIESARRSLRAVSWGEDGDLDWSGDGEEQPGTPSFVLRDGVFATPAAVAAALVELAIEGRHLWQAFADYIEAGNEFRNALRASMRERGEVQLTIKSAPDLIVPLQLLYDRKLDTSAPTFVHVCEATRAWLEAPEAEPPCLTAECPDSANDLRVCVAGFWGVRHAISISPAYRRLWEPTVPTSTPPHATLARAVDHRIDAYWTAHEVRLRHLMNIAPPEPASTSTAVLGSMRDDASVIAYFLAHVEYLYGVPRIVLNKANERGALNATTLEGVDLSARRPLIFVNACASAGVSPDRLLGLVNEFMDAGASGAVGTEIAVFVDTAVAFAEAMLASFTTGVPLGEAMRRGRIELLRQGNPLGFIYVAFGLHDLRLVHSDTLVAAV